MNTLVKELLRIFTRKVPGSLVPDSLVRGFIHAYKQLRGTQERLDFFRLVTRELGLSVNEVNTAVRLWDSAVTRGAAPATSTSASIVTSSSPDQQAVLPPLQWDAAYRAADRLASAATPLYSQLFVPISQAPDGMKFLVDMRADLMDVVAAATAAAAVAAPAQAAVPVVRGDSSSSGHGASTAATPSGSAAVAGDAREAGVHAAAAAGSVRATAPAALAVSPEEAAHLRAMAEQLRQLLAEWFSVGLLHLQHISWEESPAALLERVMRVEAVHPLGGSWEELRRRLGPRRRVFAFTHPCMPGEPLVVLHTALMDRPALCIDDILSHGDDHHHQDAQPSAAAAAAAPGPTTAVFYSISSSQPGLKGIELGHFLIQRVAERLTAEHPSLRQLVTLSPLPNFRAWLTSQLQQQQQQQQQAPAGVASSASGGGSSSQQQQEQKEQPQQLLLPAERVAVVGLARAMGWQCAAPRPASTGATPLSDLTSAAEAAAALAWLLDGDRWLSHGSAVASAPASLPAAAATSAPPSAADAASAAAAAMFSGPFAQPPQPEAAARPQPPAMPLARATGFDADSVLRPLLMRLAARYLVREKRRSFALCPVANFHLRNGASLWRINWRADMSELGLRRSLGIMVNYQYQLDNLYDNNRRYLLQHEVTTHPQVQEILTGEH
ncbi:hypothetical protein HXX76_005864 [Chlamydomonas incerta]|uniref:Malonyl-CoA decarboxylase n=1 Tax=Chlamydomonas incerta TaxID=51695 RepID=A0A835W2T1_CHLIN|nr:hypothetical protein HXX76_005864 [Chlamydomonas incerta]|eukprot:KAG2437200.1 hypothetical protein HXX76_005864 [Chlamydomonas incerta]